MAADSGIEDPTRKAPAPVAVPWPWFIGRWLLGPARLFAGYDVFISYARLDGLAFVEAPHANLKGCSVRSDLQEAKPGAKPTLGLLLAVVLRSSDQERAFR